MHVSKLPSCPVVVVWYVATQPAPLNVVVLSKRTPPSNLVSLHCSTEPEHVQSEGAIAASSLEGG
jgi:hypothetical protein